MFLLLFLLMSINYNNPVRDSLLLSVHTCSSWASSGITRNVLQPWRFLDFRMSPKMWSPMYKMSFPFAPNRSQTMSEEPVEKKHIQSSFLDQNKKKIWRTTFMFILPPEYTIPCCNGPVYVPIFSLPVVYRTETWLHQWVCRIKLLM